jgi:hypothetical protein
VRRDAVDVTGLELRTARPDDLPRRAGRATILEPRTAMWGTQMDNLRLGSTVRRPWPHARGLRRRTALAAALACALVATVAPLAANATAPTSGEGWDAATPLLGTPLLHNSQVTQMSCSSSGNCSSLGPDGTGGTYLATEIDGKWNASEELQELCTSCIGATLSASLLSCSSAGNCAVAGEGTGGTFGGNAIVDLEVDGSWGAPTVVPGLTALGSKGSTPSALSCDSSGDCVLVGTYGSNDGTNTTEPFATTESGGTWADATEVTTVAALTSSGGYAVIRALSCQAGGTCTGAGSYRDSSNAEQAFVVSESEGTWATPVQPASSATFPDESTANFQTISCSSNGNCAAAGGYYETTGASQPIVAAESGGTWTDAVVVPGVAAKNTGEISGHPDSRVTSISCTGDGDCSAGGVFTGSQDLLEDFVDTQTSGTWGSAAGIPATATSGGSGSVVESISCWSPGNCNAGGETANQDFVAPERAGTWGAPITPAASLENASFPSQIESVSCSSDGACGAGGEFAIESGGLIYDQAEVAAYSAAPLATLPGPPTGVTGAPGLGVVTVHWSAPSSTGGLPLTYIATAKPGGLTCQTAEEQCQIVGLKSTTAYTFSVEAANELGPGNPSSPTAPLFPFAPSRFSIAVAATVQSKNVPFTVVAGDATAASAVMMTLGSASASCTASSLGQCSSTLKATVNGVLTLKAVSGADTSSLAIYLPHAAEPSSIAKGAKAAITVKYCPAGASVKLSMSNGMRYTARASKAGIATFHVTFSKKGVVRVTTSVAGTSITPSESIIVR